ncbi:chromosomal protein D1 [Hoplias malabaricus]|uniref:chromosomal protein D1 n=1 Tax=Hoplias malabaricus TaxID=27720 RepID=UPI0034632696
MEVEQKDGSDKSSPTGNPAKRGRGRPKGSKKKIIPVTEVAHNARTTKQVDFFSPDTVLNVKVKKRGRPKKIRMPGRPRKIPLTAKEEADRILRLSMQRKRRLSKPLGRPRIHPLVDLPTEKRGRGRPRKYESMGRGSSQNGTVSRKLKKHLKRISEFGEATTRKRGRPQGSFKKKHSPLSVSGPAKMATQETPGKRGRPPGSGTKISARHELTGPPRKRGRPPGSGAKHKVITQKADGAPRKRGRPRGSGLKIKFVSRETDGIPRKRGRPPSSVTRLKVPTSGTPRKRGRPPGTGKAKSVAKQTDDSDLSGSSAITTSSLPRKRGRPSKASLAEASAVVKTEEERGVVIEATLPKRPRISNSGEEAGTVADVEDQKTSENDFQQAEGVGGVEKSPVQEGLVNESNNRKGASSRVAVKSQKKK